MFLHNTIPIGGGHLSYSLIGIFKACNSLPPPPPPVLTVGMATVGIAAVGIAAVGTGASAVGIGSLPPVIIIILSIRSVKNNDFYVRSKGKLGLLR